MFKNLRAEMARRDLSGKKVAEVIGIAQKTFSNKMIGKSEFTRSEMIKMQSVFFEGLSLDYLFEMDGKAKRKPRKLA
jgi:transcriptional regulator with XRE-family HTH domain